MDCNFTMSNATGFSVSSKIVRSFGATPPPYRHRCSKLNNVDRLPLRVSIPSKLNNVERLPLRVSKSKIIEATTDLRESTPNQTDVSLSMAKLLFLKEAPNKNVVFSPLSLHVVLSMIAAGSEGPSLHQLLSFLRSKSTEHLNSFASHILSVVLSDGAPVSFANGVWVEQTMSLQPLFKELLDTDYKSTLASVDFQNKADEVVKKVNSWVNKETNGLIKEVLPARSVDSTTRLILANALYFKGAWKEKFDASMTEDCDFHLLNGSSVKVPFMTSGNKQFIRAFDGFKVLRLPYKQGKDKRRFSMYFFLPDAKDGLPALAEKLASESDFLERTLPLDKVEVGDFGIPRFKISFDFEASNMLKELGVVSPFSVSGGGLTKMVESPMNEELFISKVFHKSVVEVNEEGTKAAAVTCATLECCAPDMRRSRIDFVADHPFLFLIREDLTGTVLFTGQLLNPNL